MATIIRLARFGRKHYPTYRFTVADSRRRPTGKFLEQLGHYNPNIQPPTIKINEENVIKWLSCGAQMSDTVKRLLTKTGTLEKFDQVKKGTDFANATSTPHEWVAKKPKPSKKSIEKEQAKKAAEEQAITEAAETEAPKTDSTEKAPVK